MELNGIVKKIGDTQTFPSGFQKREMVILTKEQYPQPISIELLGDKIDIIDPFKEGDDVIVGINLRGREWLSPQGETKYFNSITAWKITRPVNESNQSKTQTTVSNENPFAGDDEDDLPF